MGSVFIQGGALLLGLLYHTLVALLIAVPATVIRLVRQQWRKPLPESWKHATFWEGSVYHVRKKPARNEFRYPVRFAIVDLDSYPTWFAKQARDHMTAAEARKFAGTDGPVCLLTNPISAGYIQNPISVYYCYSAASNELQRCIAEVTNTPWGDRVTFWFEPGGAHVKKVLHVSPMMDMDSRWYLEASDPHSTGFVKLIVNAEHSTMGHFFQAALEARLSDMPHHPNEHADPQTVLRYAFQPHRTAFWIYIQAVILVVRKGVPFFNPPSNEYRSGVVCTEKDRTGSVTWRDTTRWAWKA